MNVRLDDGPVQVTLSRRNLRELLAELDSLLTLDGRMPHDGRAVLSRQCAIGETESVFLIVEAQEDNEHYGSRRPGTLGMLLDGG